MSEVKKPKILAFVGKGGVGKTSISALTVRILKEEFKDKRILAIDADPAVGLSTALGVEAKSTVDDIRKLFVENAEKGDTKAAIEILGEAKYQLFDALVEVDNVSFLAIGRPEAAGCYCKVNTYLKEVIGLISNHFDYVIIDGEAGIEQINRRVMDKVTHLVMVSDASKKGLQVVKTIYDVAESLVMFEKSGLIVNRIVNEEYVNTIDTHSLSLLTVIPDDKVMTISDMMGTPVFEIDKGSTIYKKTREALVNLEIL